jgi:twinkle protein
MSSDIIPGDYRALVSRGISEDTCRKLRYRVGVYKGQPVQLADHTLGGAVVGQKVRTKDKKFSCVGVTTPLWAKEIWPSTGRRIVITEGEIDALSVAEATGRTWPVVSLANGAQSAAKSIKAELEWLLGFETIVLAFDDDEAGHKAVAECVDLFPAGRVAVANYNGYKDANEMLVAGKVKELNTALWQAKEYRPDGIVSLDQITEKVFNPPSVGLSWCLPTLSTATYGRRLGDLIGIGGGTGCGKSDFIAQQMVHDIKLGLTVGGVLLEQSVADTGKRVAGKLAGRRFHVADGSWAQSDLESAWAELVATKRLYLYDSYGAMDWDTIRSKIRYMVTSLGCKSIVLDHLTALAANEDDERKALDAMLAEMSGMAQSLQFIFTFVSHLATPEGKPHEEGGRVMLKHFRGSRAIGFWSHAVLGIERDTQSPDSPSYVRVLKDRHSGDANGLVIPTHYDRATGLLSEGEYAGTVEGDDAF